MTGTLRQTQGVQGTLAEVQGEVCNPFAARFHLASTLRVPAEQALAADSQ